MWKVLVKQGDTVEEGQLLCIIEAMKMENEITAHKAGTIVELPITEGAPIQAGAPIATIKSDEGGLADGRRRQIRQSAATFSACSRRWAAPRRPRGSSASAPSRERLQVGDVLLEDRQRPLAVQHRAVAGHDVLGAREQRAQALERRQVGAAVSRRRRASGISTAER